MKWSLSNTQLIIHVKEKWQPSQQSQTKIDIKGYEQYGEWSVQSLSTWGGAKSTVWGRQLTVPMPLEAIYKLMVDLKRDGKTNPILSSQKKDAIHIVRKEDFAAAELHEITSITDDLLGFFSLVVSYAKATRRMQAQDGPKHSLSIMPRTDFAAMYSLVSSKIKPQYSDCWDLFQIVKALAAFDGDGTAGKDKSWSGDQLDTATFKWIPVKQDSVSGDNFAGDSGQAAAPAPPPPAPALPPKKPGKSKRVDAGDAPDLDLSGGTLKVQTWLKAIQDTNKDLIAAMEKALRYGQVGQLGKFITINRTVSDIGREQDGEYSRLGTCGSNLRIP